MGPIQQLRLIKNIWRDAQDTRSGQAPCQGRNHFLESAGGVVKVGLRTAGLEGWGFRALAIGTQVEPCIAREIAGGRRNRPLAYAIEFAFHSSASPVKPWLQLLT
jgi:hypothetical protein